MGHEAAVLKSITGRAMSLLGVDVGGTVDGLLFELTVQQRYRNATANNIEAVYTFPVPSGAALLDLDVHLGDKLLTGVVVEKRAAEEEYEKAIDKGDTAIMLERVTDGLYTINLGNLMAGEEATIRYVYAQTLRYEHGSARLTVPTVIAPRYGNSADAGFQPHQVPAHDLGVQYPLTLSIELLGPMADGNVSSPSHPIAVAATEGGITVTLGNATSLDRDFVLSIVGLNSQSSAILAKDGDEYVALASFCAEVPPSASELPLRLKLLIDCSGSMAGDSISASKRALHRILERLQPNDEFSLSVFGSNVVHVLDTLTSASAATIAAIAVKVGGIDANLGGTEMAKALTSVFQISGPEGAAEILLISDGQIMGVDSLVAEARAARQRVFVVGIGSAPAEAVLRRLAEATGGACEFVAPKEDVEAAIIRMFHRLRSPRIERVDITWPQTPRWTTPLPRGLFGGETIHVYAGFGALPTGTVGIELRQVGDGTTLRATAMLPALCSANPQVARMAALTRILTADSTTQLRLALDYRLLTDRTNFIVVHVRTEEDKATQLPRLQKIAQMHAAGWGGVGSVLVERSVSVARGAKASVSNLMLFCEDLEDALAAPQAASTSAKTKDVRVSAAGWAASPVIDWTPLLRALDAHYTASLGRLPTTLGELRRLGVREEVMSELAVSINSIAVAAYVKDREPAVVRAFLARLEPWGVAAGVSRHLLRALRQLVREQHRFALPRQLVALIGKPAADDVQRR